MADKFNGRVVRIELDGKGRACDSALLGELVMGVDCVTAHAFDSATRTLVVFIEPDETDEDDLLRAIASTQLYPIRRVRIDEVNGAGGYAC